MQIKNKMPIFILGCLLITINGCDENQVEKVETHKEIKSTTQIEDKSTKNKESINNLSTVSKTITVIETPSILKSEESSNELSIIASGDSAKGQKIYSNKLKSSCGISGAKFAHKHTQEEWGQIKNNGKLAEEIKSICNGTKIRNKYLLDISAFVIEFASDSGNVPTGCS